MSSNSSSSGIMSSTSAPKTSSTKRVASKKDVPAADADASVVAAPAPAPVETAVAAPKKRTTKAAATTATASAPASVPAAVAVSAAPSHAPAVVSSTPVEAASVPVAVTTTWDEELRTIAGNLNTLRETASTLLGQLKRLEKNVRREMKDARKRRRRVKLDENGVEVKRAPSIFERPTQVTAELLTFLGRPAASLMSRSEVTKAVNEYVKAHDLKNKHDIKPDAPLRKLLAIGEGEPLTYFNLQRYLNRHYIKAVVAPVATA